MVELYLKKIGDGVITVEDVPELWKSKVQEKLNTTK